MGAKQKQKPKRKRNEKQQLTEVEKKEACLHLDVVGTKTCVHTYVWQCNVDCTSFGGFNAA